MIQSLKSLHIYILAIFFLPALIFAQVFKMTTKDLTKESSAIVVGKCVAKESYWNKKHDKIFTRIKFAVEQIEEFKEMEGVAGVHLMAIEWEHRVPEIAERANVLPRPQV